MNPFNDQQIIHPISNGRASLRQRVVLALLNFENHVLILRNYVKFFLISHLIPQNIGSRFVNIYIHALLVQEVIFLDPNGCKHHLIFNFFGQITINIVVKFNSKCVIVIILRDYFHPQHIEI